MEAHVTRHVTSNPLPIDGSGRVAPQQVHAIPRATDTDPLTLSTTLTPWSTIAGKHIQGPAVLSAKPRNVYFNGVKGNFVAAETDLGAASLTAPEWTWSSNTVIIKDTGESDPATFYGGAIVANYRTYTPTSGPIADRNYRQLRVLYHPDFANKDGTTGLALEYPSLPDRTQGYYHSPLRKHDVNIVSTLQGSVNALELQRWEDVVVTEVWTGGREKLSMLARFFETLHLMRITTPTIGRYMSWCPFDLSFGRHLIQPIALSVGSQQTDVSEIRDRLESGTGETYLDQTVTFSFKLIAPIPQVGSLLTLTGV